MIDMYSYVVDWYVFICSWIGMYTVRDSFYVDFVLQLYKDFVVYTYIYIYIKHLYICLVNS